MAVRHECISDEDYFPFIWAFKYLTAPFAWRKSCLRAVREYDQSKAGVSETLAFAADLQFLGPQYFPAAYFEGGEEVGFSLYVKGCIPSFPNAENQGK